MRRFLLLLSLSVMPLVAAAARFEESVGLQFPDQLGKLQFTARNEFPTNELGVSLAYERPAGFLRGAVYIYTGGLRRIPADIDAPVVRKHFDQVIGEVKQMETLGKVRSVKLSGDAATVTRAGGCGPQFIRRGYEIDLDGRNMVKSLTYLTAVNDHFIKLRITHRNESEHDQQDIDEFVDALRKVLGRCP